MLTIDDNANITQRHFAFFNENPLLSREECQMVLGARGENIGYVSDNHAVWVGTGMRPYRSESSFPGCQLAISRNAFADSCANTIADAMVEPSRWMVAEMMIAMGFSYSLALRHAKRVAEGSTK